MPENNPKTPDCPDRLTGNPSAAEVADLLARLRDISDRLARFEDVPQADLDAFQAAKRRLVERIEPGFYDDEEPVVEVGKADVLGDLMAAGKLDDVPFDYELPVRAARAVTCLVCNETMPADDIDTHRATEHGDQEIGAARSDSGRLTVVMDMLAEVVDEFPIDDPSDVEELRAACRRLAAVTDAMLGRLEAAVARRDAEPGDQ